MDGEAGIGKTTLLRAWAGVRTAAGDTVLVASCGPLDRSMPLDALLTALAGLLRGLGPEAAADILGADAALLAPLLNLAPGPRLPPMLADSMLGPAVLYSALVRALGRLAERAPLVVVADDAHLAGPALPDWLRFARRENLAFTAVAAVRSGEGEPLPATASIHLGALGRDAAAELVGPGRFDELYDRSKGHPLFLTELAQQATGAELPMSLVESVSARCDELGSAGLLLRTAAVIGPDLDVNLLAAVLGRPAVALLDDAEEAVAKQFLVDQGGMFRFRHELVREALAASATAGRAALLHRQAGRVLDRRPGADPLIVAGHARLGGDLALASRALREASARAAECFDYAAAEALLDDAMRLDACPDGWLARARVRTLRGRYAEALADVERAGPAGPAARGQIGVEHTSATMHSLLFTGHAHALAGRPAQALDALARYTAEVERRQVPRFAGRAVNFAGWVLRNLGAWPEALDHHHEALEAGQGQGTADVTIAALEDLAEQCLATGDPDGARARLAEASALLQGNLVFGWRLRLKHQLLTGRLALLAGDAEQALAQARELEARAAALGVPRYTSVARLLAHRANHALGEPADPDAVAADLDLLDGAAAIEAWWWTCDLAGDFAQPAWRDRAADRAARLARGAGGYADGLLDAGEPGGGRARGQDIGVACPRAGREGLVPVGRLVTERPEGTIYRVFGPMRPTWRERAGGDGGANPTRLGQAIFDAVQVVEAERGQHQVEAAITKRQRDRVGQHGRPAAAAPQHALGQIRADHPARPRRQRGLAGYAGARAQVEHQAAGQRHRRGRHQPPGQRRVHRPGAAGPVACRGVVVGAQFGGQLRMPQFRRAAARTDSVSHHASSSSYPPSAFSQPNKTIAPSRHSASWRSHQGSVSMPQDSSASR